ncbi:MAG: metal ABC transporter solute-binding protein, Zn/Mn family [Xanthobacteraceae bacterium]
MRRHVILAAAFAALITAPPARAEHKLNALASFSILADLVRNVGGDRVIVDVLVGPDGNAHTYSPSPADAKKAAAANIVLVNGLGFEGWLERLIKASGARAPIVVVSNGIRPRERAADHGHGAVDPHAWQSVANVKMYVTNIRAALTAVDPGGKAAYQSNTEAYLSKLDALEQEVKDVIAGIPADRRNVITSHNAFGYFEDAYGIHFSAPQGVSTDAEASAKDVAAIITQARQQKAAGVFLENVTDPRLVQQIARETGSKVGGKLYSDALTDANGDAPSYIALMRYNIKQLAGFATN